MPPDIDRELLPTSKWQLVLPTNESVPYECIVGDVSLRAQIAACLTNSLPFQTFRTILFVIKTWNVFSVICSTG
jgi:ubiquitin C-terminal hydrolase